MTIARLSKLLAAAAALLFAATGHAGITLLGGSGMPVLTLLNQTSGFATGSVGIDVQNREFMSGNVAANTRDTGARTLGELGVYRADAVRLTILADPSQPAASLRLQNLILSIWDPSGALLFSSGQFSPVTLDAATYPMGWSLALDPGSVALAQRTAFAGAFLENRVGLFASISDAYAGAERFYVSGAIMPAPVPEPSTYAMCIAGLALIGWVARRRAS
jgi:hypothetical protein